MPCILQEKFLKEFQESLSVALKNLQKVLEANEGGQGFFVGKKVGIICKRNDNRRPYKCS